MIYYDTDCAVCERSIPAEEVENQLCDGCGSLICDDHSGDPIGSHEPEDHMSTEDAEGVLEPYPYGA
jgi:hypothetical protein